MTRSLMETMNHDPSSDITETQRKILCVPQDKIFTIPLKCIEVIKWNKDEQRERVREKKVNINEQNIKISYLSENHTEST